MRQNNDSYPKNITFHPKCGKNDNLIFKSFCKRIYFFNSKCDSRCIIITNESRTEMFVSIKNRTDPQIKFSKF